MPKKKNGAIKCGSTENTGNLICGVTKNRGNVRRGTIESAQLTPGVLLLLPSIELASNGTIENCLLRENRPI